jgi:hypothetical protein
VQRELCFVQHGLDPGYKVVPVGHAFSMLSVEPHCQPMSLEAIANLENLFRARQRTHFTE